MWVHELWEQETEERCDIFRKGRGCIRGVDFVGPVVLAAERYPAELFVQHLLDGEGFVDRGVLWREEGCLRGGRGEREEGSTVRRIGHVVVEVEIAFVDGVGDVSVDQSV